MNLKIKNDYLVSFFGALVIALTGLILAGVYPFGVYSSACSDLRYQYISFAAQNIRNIKNLQNPLISYNGAGLDIFSMQYIKDPFSVLLLIFDAKYYHDVFLFTSLIKIALAAVSLTYYLKHSYRVHLSGGIACALSWVYAYSSFCITGLINIQFLPNVIFLPIVLLGIEKVIYRNRIGLLFFSYLICVYFDYYLAYMTGIFAVCYFMYCFFTQQSIDKKHFFKSFFLCGIGAVSAVGIQAAMLLPIWANVSGNYMDVTVKTDIPFVQHSAAQLAKALMIIPDNAAGLGGLNIFIGIFPLIGTLFFLSDNKISKKERTAALIFVVFMLLGMMLRPIYEFWHLFRQPVGFNGRFSYTISFLFIILTAKYLEMAGKNSIKFRLLPFCILFAAAVYAVVSSAGLWPLIGAGISLIFAVVYTAFINKKTVYIAVAAEAVVMCCVGLHNQKISDHWEPRQNYINTLENTRNLVKKTDDSGFYRMTDVVSNDTNMSAAADYTSLETFSSSTNQNAVEKLFQLGICAPYDYREILNYSNSIVSEGLFGIKYIMVSDHGSAQKDALGREIYTKGGYTSSQRLTSDNYEKISSDENGILYKNKTAFPLMFAVNEEAVTSSERFYDKQYAVTGGYANQAVLLNDMFGTDYQLYEPYPMMPSEPVNASLEPNGEYTTLKPNLQNGHTVAASPEEVGYMTYTYKAEQDGDYVIDARTDFKPGNADSKQFNCIANGALLNNVYNIYSKFFTNDIGCYKKGDTIEITYQTLMDLDIMPPMLLKLRYDEFEKLYQKAQENALSDIDLEKNNITAVSDSKDSRLIFTSFAYYDGFHIYIDGKETEKVKISDAFLGFRVPEGKHDIKITYETIGIKAGIAVSAAFMAAAVLVMLLLRSFEHKEVKK